MTESEAVDIRKKRQEEWEKVRTAADPIERPEEPYDNRSLFDRLQEQKQKKDLEYEEAHKLKNMIKGLDDDEIDFLDLVDRTKLAADRIKTQEEEKELNDYRNRVATLQEKELDQKLATGASLAKPKVAQAPKRSQLTLLQGAVVKKSPNEKKRKLDDNDSVDPQGQNGCVNQKETHQSTAEAAQCANVITIPKTRVNTGLKCVGILPGLGHYDNSSTDTSDSDSEPEDNCCKVKRDLLGRAIVTKEEND